MTKLLLKARQMLQGQGTREQRVTLTPPRARVEEIRFHGLLEVVQGRLVWVVLETGEYEVIRVNQSLAPQETQYPQPVTHAIAFNAIQNQVFELLASDLASQILIKRLEVLFTKTPTVNKDGM